MPARDRQPSSPSPAADEEEGQVLTRGKQTAISRRKTTAFDEQIDPALQSSHPSKNAGPRQSMPSRTLNDLVTTPRSSGTLGQIRNSSQEHTPKRTPVFKGPTVDQRFEMLLDNSKTILSFYQNYVERLAEPEIELAADMDHQIARYWDIFSTTKKHHVFPMKVNEEEFFDTISVLEGNTVDPTSELAVEIIDNINEANRATFVHLVAQLPFQLSSPLSSSEYSHWTVDKLNDYLSQDMHDRWPIRDIEELMLARKEFFKKIVPHRRKVLVTLDDLHLYLDLCTQVAVYYLWEYVNVRTAKERQNKIDKELSYIFSVNPVVDAFEEGEARDLIEATYEKMAKDRVKRLQEHNFAPAAVQKEFPFQVTAAVLLNYINGVRAAPNGFPLDVFDTGLAMPRSLEHIYSPALRFLYGKTAQGGLELNEEIADDAHDPDQDAEGDIEVEEQLPASGRSGRLRFNKDSRLERVESEHRATSIISRRGDVEAIRDTEFDQGDSDVFLEKRTRATATRGKGKKRAVQARKGRAAASKASVREGDSEDEAMPAAVSSQAAIQEEQSDEEMPDVAALLAQKGKGVQQAIGNDATDFEVNQEELQATQKESEERRGERHKRKRAEREESEYLPPSAGPSTEHTTTQESAEGHVDVPAIKEKKPKQERLVYRYATGGNQLGRVAWSAEEKDCLLNDLQELYPRYLEALSRNVRFPVWKEILKRHGKDGTVSLMLKNRNNVQCKDKARNEIERRKRADEPIPEWLQPYA